MAEKKTYKVLLAVSLAVFLLLCGALVARNLSAPQDDSEKPADSQQNVSDTPAQQGAALTAGRADSNKPASRNFNVIGAEPSVVFLGAADPCKEDPDTGYKFQLEIRSVGAAVRKVTFSSVGKKGFNDRHYKNPQPLVLIKPVITPQEGQVMTMANTEFNLIGPDATLSLNRMSWKNLGLVEDDKTQSVSMEAFITGPDGTAILKLVKTYSVTKGSFLADCNLTVENLSQDKHTVQFNMNGPVGIQREDARTEDRNIVAAFIDNNDLVPATRDLVLGFPMNLTGKKADIKTTWQQYQDAVRLKDEKQKNIALEKLQLGYNLPDRRKITHFSWAAVSNKYFTSVVRPQPETGAKYCNWLDGSSCVFLNPDNDTKGGNTGDESIGIRLRTKQSAIAAGEKTVYKFQLYFGPKDKQLFTKNEQFKKWGFINIITFSACCCCPIMVIIRPLAFGILTLMEWIYYFIPNYGIAIIILVFIVRLILHPLTRKSQVSMSKMSKLAPKMEEIKKKYADDKAELNKQMMALYKEHGASPFLGMIPMFIQMPIWIALYSAIYASISLRGAPFLPVWITDLSSPDAIVRFPLVVVPLLGWKINSLNLLPILMGVAFYLQQKLTPQQTTSANPQQAAQQKMMMIMMPILFPLMLYSAPSGLNLYIMASTFAGAIEQYIIKKQIQTKEQLESQGLVDVTSKTGGKVKKKKPKPFFKRYV